jgi:hypothetical protein
MPSSTRPAPIGFALDRVPDDDLAMLLKVARKDVAAMRKALAAQHADPAWIAETLDALPAATLAVLHLVIDGGGIVPEEHLYRRARDHFAMSELDFQAAAFMAVQRLLVVPLETPRGVALGVLWPAAGLIAPLVAGLDLLELSPHAFVASDHGVRNARTFLAVCAATRHVDIKVTNEGRPHRSATKRLAKLVGLDDSTLEDMLLTGMSTEVLSIEEDILRPEPAALLEAAAGRYPFSPLIVASQDRLAQGPLPIYDLLQSLLRRHDLTISGYVGIEAFEYLPGFVTGMVGNVKAVALRMPEGVAAGHVTPSFEVMLPPEARLLDIVQVGVCCDWERLDRAIVGRVSKASVMRAVAAGSSGAEIVTQLGAASRHPIPQNVEAAIHDWAGSVIAATIASGHVVMVDPRVRDRVAGVIAGLGGRELAPGVFLVERNDGLRAIQTALSRAGAVHRALSPARPVPAPPAAAAAPTRSPTATRVRARVAAWRRNEAFEGKRDDFLERNRKVQGADVAAIREVEQQLARWERQHGGGLDHEDPAYHALIGILGSLPPATRTRLFATSADVAQLLRALSKHAGPVRPASLGGGPRRGPRRPPPLLWQEEGLQARLQHAASEVEALALQLPGQIRFVEIDSVLRRGNAWMVLGNEVVSGESVAVRLDDIRAIAALPDDLAAYDLDPVIEEALADLELDDDLDDDDLADEIARKPWHPAPGQAPPAGHLPCPCGSGERYRSCCRNIPRA